MSHFIAAEMNQTFNSHLNVVIYRKQDWNANFVITGLYDEYHQNRRYFQSTEPEGFNFSVLILETNNTLPYYPPHQKEKNDQEKLKGGLTYTKKKSPSLTSAQ